MNKLVFIENNRPVTDSLTIADVFGKRHSDVLRSIDNLGCSHEFNERNFASVEYQDAKGEARRKVIMTEQGFTMVVMGYTGQAAMQFKEKYIQAFHDMRNELERNRIVPLNDKQALIQTLRLTADLAEEMVEVKEEIKALKETVEEQITIDHGEQRRIQKAVSRRVYDLESEPSARSELFRQLYREIKDRWAVASYRDVRRNELNEVISYIEAWKPRVA